MPDSSFLRSLLERNRYLCLATVDGDAPWIAPLEYLLGDDFDLYFFSTTDSRHARHIESSGRVAFAVFDQQQPEYDPAATLELQGVQAIGQAHRLSEAEAPSAMLSGARAMGVPMPPYAIYRIRPERVWAPRIMRGVNERVEIPL